MFLSTLRRYVEAMVGDMELVARFPEPAILTNQASSGQLGEPPAITALRRTTLEAGDRRLFLIAAGARRFCLIAETQIKTAPETTSPR